MNTAIATVRGRSRGWSISLWAVQVLLAVLFGFAGLMKLATPYADLLRQGAWVHHVSEPLIKFIGIAEIMGALGLILPAATRVKPFLTPLAASGFVVIMVLAIALHLSIGEAPIAEAVIGALAAFVAWGRFRKALIHTSR